MSFLGPKLSLLALLSVPILSHLQIDPLNQQQLVYGVKLNAEVHLILSDVS